jgi:hypothetical protein
MKINILKAISIVVCFFVASLWSNAQCMDNQNDILETSTVNRTSNIQSSSQNEIAALDLEDKTSWASYLISPVKVAFKTANALTTFAIHNPKLATIMAFWQVVPLASAACTCYCWNQVRKECRDYGEAEDYKFCVNMCGTFDWLPCGLNKPNGCVSPG